MYNAKSRIYRRPSQIYFHTILHLQEKNEELKAEIETKNEIIEQLKGLVQYLENGEKIDPEAA